MSRQRSSEFPGVRVVHKGHANVVHSVAFSPDGKSIVSGSMDRTVRIWEAHGPSSGSGLFNGHNHGVCSVAYSPNGKLVASGSTDQTIRLWNVDNREEKSEPLSGHVSDVNSVTFSHDGKYIASGSSDKSIRLWDVQSRVSSASFTGHYSRVNSIGFSPNDAHITSGSADATIRVWDVQRQKTILGPLQGHKNLVQSVSYSPEGSQIVSGSVDKTIRLWDTRSGKMTAEYGGHTGSVTSVVFSPNGLYVASGSYDKTIRIWDVRTGSLAIAPIQGHDGYVFSVAFSPSGNHLVSGSNDGQVIVWTIPEGYLETKPTVNQVERPRVSHHLSMKEMFDLLLQHGCVNLTSQMDSSQDSNLLVSGGGFGDIWTGRLQNGTKVAIKVWRASVIEQIDGKILKRATREVYYWSRMDHQHIHKLLGVIIFKERSLGMVSEWMENGNLREYMRKNDNFDRYEMCRSIALGLAYMHQRDTPNVLVSSGGVAKLADFGLSTMSEASLGFSDTSNPQLGSTRWAAPELLSEESSKNKESDVYALGMTMLEVITGELPYPQCHSDYQVIMKVTRGIQPARPTAQLKDTDRDNQLWELIVSCWNQDPSARPSAQQVLESVRLKIFMIIVHFR